MNRDDYMSGAVDHQTFYLAVADAIGRQHVEAIVRRVATPERIKAALLTDEHLNNIQLEKWDRCHGPILGSINSTVMAVSWSARSPLQPGTVCWSLSDTVCTLKAAARRMAEELEVAP